jgi:hypothetical protein
MPTKRKTKSKVAAVSAPTVSHPKETHLDIRDQIITVVLMISVFLLGLLFTDQMSRAMAAVMNSGYQQQLSIGPTLGQSVPITTGLATSTVVAMNGGVSINFDVPIGNILGYQIFVAPSSTPVWLVDINSYDCSHKLVHQTQGDNQVSAVCISTPGSPLIPNAGDAALLRYIYREGPNLWCGDGMLSGYEMCDDAAYNGQPGRCNRTCDGMTAGGTSTTTPVRKGNLIPRQPLIPVAPIQ